MAIRFYNRILLKLSGEALSGDLTHGICKETLSMICNGIKKAADTGAQIGIVVGGGNIWRGRDAEGMNRTRADHIGMLATIMNALSLADALEKTGAVVRVQSAIPIIQFAEPYIRQKALSHMGRGRIVVFGGGTGNPYFSTDSAAALRAAELGADALFKATMVDGVYDKDPNKDITAVKYDELSHKDILVNDLKVLDGAAVSICRESNIPCLVFDIRDPDNIYRAVCGDKIGTLVT
ncbi:MAG: UMP kinase [Oscillospiraceae bacterium]|nr:UMP kinase [Oscillospiraceae bacterium]